MLKQFPYADWELETYIPSPNLPVQPSAQDLQDRWHPVFVECRAETVEDVDDFIKQSRERSATAQASYQFDYHALDALDRLRIALKSSRKDVAERFRRIYLYMRSSTLSQMSETYPNFEGLFSVLSISPALPIVPENNFAPAPSHDESLKTFQTNISGACRPQSTIVTAVIDDLIGIANERFRHAPTTTRIERFWPQVVPLRKTPAGDFDSGIVCTDADINQELAATATSSIVDEEAFYRSFYRPRIRPLIDACDDKTIHFAQAAGVADLQDAGFQRPVTFRASHGTHVLDLAAGDQMAQTNDLAGDEITRPIFAVQLPPLATSETSGARLEQYILSGVQAILGWADSRQGGPAPCVINLSYGTQAGPKNGEGFLEREVARLIRLRNAEGILTRFVVAAGNGYRARSRSEITVHEDAPKSINWQVRPQDQSSNFLEIWSEKHVDIVIKHGEKVILTSTHTETKTTDGSHAAARLYRVETDTARGTIIALAPTINHGRPNQITRSGAYKVTVSTPETAPQCVALEVQRDESPINYRDTGYQSYIDDPNAYEYDKETGWLDRYDDNASLTHDGTLNALATMNDTQKIPEIYVAAAYTSDFGNERVAQYSASGGGHISKTPTLSAKADRSQTLQGQLASGTFSGGKLPMSGTSVAAPLITRRLVDAGGDLIAEFSAPEKREGFGRMIPNKAH